MLSSTLMDVMIGNNWYLPIETGRRETGKSFSVFAGRALQAGCSLDHSTAGQTQQLVGAVEK